MFIPILIDLIHYNKRGHLFLYYKYSYHCFHENWPLITDEHFTDWNQDWASSIDHQGILWEYHRLPEKSQEKLWKYCIPRSFTEELEKSQGSRLGASLLLQKERYQPLEELLEKFLADVKARTEEPIEGFIVLEKVVKSVQTIADKYQIPIIGIGMGPLRGSTYRNTAYLCQGDVYATGECQTRYEKFCKQISPDTAFFDRKELLSLFLEPSSIQYLSVFDVKPTLEMCIAGSYGLMPTLFSDCTYADCELVNEIREKYWGKFRFRQNPADPFGATYQMPASIIDRLQPGILSILNSKRMAAVGGNILFDIMLWGRTPCCKTDLFPMSFMCQQDYMPREYQPVPLSFLNFFCFAYLIPFELMLDPTYLRWRLTGPSEMEIYQHNLNYYLEKKGIPQFIVDLPKTERFKALLHIQGYDAHLADDFPAQAVRERFQQFIRECTPPVAPPSEAQRQLDIVLNSTCWRMTAPLRKVMDRIKLILKK